MGPRAAEFEAAAAAALCGAGLLILVLRNFIEVSCVGRYNVEAWRPGCGSCLYKAALRRGVRPFKQSFGDATGTLNPTVPKPSA